MITNTCRTLGVVNAVAGAAPSVPAHASAHAHAASRAAKRTRRHVAARPAGVRGDEYGEGVERIESVLLWACDYGLRRGDRFDGGGWFGERWRVQKRRRCFEVEEVLHGRRVCVAIGEPRKVPLGLDRREHRRMV